MWILVQFRKQKSIVTKVFSEVVDYKIIKYYGNVLWGQFLQLLVLSSFLLPISRYILCFLNTEFIKFFAEGMKLVAQE